MNVRRRSYTTAPFVRLHGQRISTPNGLHYFFYWCRYALVFQFEQLVIWTILSQGLNCPQV